MILVRTSMLAGDRSGYLARSVYEHADEQYCSCPKDCNAHGLSRATVSFRVVAPRKRQRPQHRKCNERRANIEQRCVWNSLNESLAVLGAGEKAVTVNDG